MWSKIQIIAASPSIMLCTLLEHFFITLKSKDRLLFNKNASKIVLLLYSSCLMCTAKTQYQKLETNDPRKEIARL